MDLATRRELARFVRRLWWLGLPLVLAAIAWGGITRDMGPAACGVIGLLGLFGASSGAAAARRGALDVASSRLAYSLLGAAGGIGVAMPYLMTPVVLASATAV